LANETLTKSELIDAIIKHPILLERPIAITNKKAIIGRPPQAVLNII
jgi:arsenate reductase